MSVKDSGILYVASSEKYFREAIISVKTVRKLGIKLPVVIFVSKDLCEEAKSYFDDVLVIDQPQNSFVDKITPIRDSPFVNTLFLDTDTKVYEDITHLYSLLEKFDLAFSVAPVRNGYNVDVPEWFLEPNTGVLLYRKSTAFYELVNEWLVIYQRQLNSKNKPPHDQSSLRLALFYSSMSFYVLGCEYNFRSVFPCVIPGNISIKIFHDRHPLIITDSLYEISTRTKVESYRLSPKIFLPDLQKYRTRLFVVSDGMLRIPNFKDLVVLIWLGTRKRLRRVLHI
ncbi:MAG: hypothetical protein WAU36_18730 [Cyclobacteriaceae bacterium]